MRERLPEYLKRPIIDTDTTRNVRKILKHNCLKMRDVLTKTNVIQKIQQHF